MTAASLGQRITDGIEGLVDRSGRLTSWLILGVVGTLFLQIPMREFVHYGHREVNDLGQMLHATVFMVGAAYAMRWDGHVRVDILYNRMTPRQRALVNLVGTLVLMLPWLVVVTRDSIPVVLNSWRTLEEFPETFTAGYFLLKSQLIVFSILVGLQALANIIRNLRIVRGAAADADR